MTSVDHAVPLGITRLETQRDRVQAIALSGRLGTIIEEMAKVAAAPGARDLDSANAQAHILVNLDGSPSGWLEEAGSAGARIVLRLGTDGPLVPTPAASSQRWRRSRFNLRSRSRLP
jgi:hypothetical protein